MSKRAVWCVLAGVLMAGIVRAAELKVDFTFSAADVELTTAGEYTVVALADGSSVVDEVGAPSIPAKFVNVLIPSGARNVSIAASGEWTLLAEGITPYPAQPRSPKSRSKPAFVPANARYASAAAWPAEIATYQGDHSMQGYQFVSVRVNPLAYVGAEKKLYLREKVTVTVTYDAPVAAKKILPRQQATFEPLVQSLVVNPEAAAEFAPALETRAPKAALDYLIITSATLSNAFQQIANYRASAAGGSYTTRVMTTNDIGSAYSGADLQAKIRACISNNVATLGTTMVLLGGDDTVVPVRGCKVSAVGETELTMPTDLYYSGLGGSWDGNANGVYGETSDGVDLAYDVVVARLPMRTVTQVTNYLNKVMTYEAGWNVTNKIMLGGPYAWDTWTGNSRPSDDVTGDGHAGFRSTNPAHDSVSDSEAWLRRLYRDGIRSYWPAQVNIMCDTITSWDPSYCGSYVQSAANTALRFNQNYTHLMFSGHGFPQGWGLESGDFTYLNADSQTGLTAFVYTDACLTGHFDKNSITLDGYTYATEPCLGEGFLRNSRVRGGALAHMGCARYGWGSPGSYDGGPSTVYAYKFYKRMYETTNRTLGLAFAMHKADMASQSGTDDCERWIQFGMNLLGDPALKMPRDVPVPAAPVFTSAASFSATTGVAQTHSVVADGYPWPELALRSSTASAGSYSFAANTGVLTYTPPVSDRPSKTFTFTASNTQGVVTQVVTANVTLAPPAAPASVWASATNTTDFMAAWSASAGATSYRLDVSTNANFAVSIGGGGTVQLGESMDSGLSTSYQTGDVTLTSGVWNVVQVLKESSAESYGGTGGAARLNDDTPGACIRTPALNSVGSIAFWYRELNTGGGEFILQKSYDGSTWIGVHTQAFSGNTYVRYSNDVADAASTVYLRVLNDNQAGHLILDEFEITSFGTSEPSFVPGYSNRTVTSTSQSVTGLVAGATYYFRVRAVNDGGSSPNSAVANVTTLATLSAPVFGANPGPIAATAGVDAEFTVSASGVPAPTLSLDSTTAAAGSYEFDAATGDVLYIAPQSDAGQRTFTFSAVNSQGTAYQTVTVNVTAATAPAFTGGAGPYSTTVGVEVAFTVSASGVPAPALALQSQTASSGYSFTPATGAFTYTPPAGDVGTQTFTFTAANAAGTVTQVTSIAVAAVPTAPDAPASIWASATNATDFTAAWSAVSNAASYRLDVGTNATFSGGSGLSEQVVLASNGATAASVNQDGWSAVDTSGTTYAQMLKSTSTITTPAFSTVGLTNLTVHTRARTYGGATGSSSNITISISTDNGVNWVTMGVVSAWVNTMQTLPTLTNTANLGHSQTKIRWQTLGATGSIGVGVTNLVVQGWTEGAGAPSYIPGYSNRTVTVTSESVTGLVAQSTYYFRVRAVNNGGSSGNSATGQVTTTSADPFEQWLVEQGQNPQNPDFAPDADMDGDGMTTWEEYQAGTDPADASSLLKLEGEFSVTADELRYTFPAHTGRYYQLIYATNLAGPFVTSNLGWGVPGIVITNDATGDWFGGVRAWTEQPSP